MENKEIAIMNQFPAEQYNLLIPVATMQEVSPLYKSIINTVHISPDIQDKDVYKQGNELALTKKGLAKLMTASNIQIVPELSGPIKPTVCEKCIEVAKATKLAPRCGDCPSRNDVACVVTIAIPDPAGQPRLFQARKNLIYKDAKSATEKQFLYEQCESKALNRALRGAMMIKSTYTAKELAKPFVVSVTVANMADEDMKKAMIARYTTSSAALFGNNPTTKALNAPINEENLIIITEEDEEDIPVMETEIIEEKPGVGCEVCGQVIKAGDGKWTIEAIVEYSQKTFKKVACIDCQNDLRSEAKKAKEARK